MIARAIALLLLAGACARQPTWAATPTTPRWTPCDRKLEANCQRCWNPHDNAGRPFDCHPDAAGLKPR
jgi:hypothetical protein